MKEDSLWKKNVQQHHIMAKVRWDSKLQISTTIVLRRSLGNTRFKAPGISIAFEDDIKLMLNYDHTQQKHRDSYFPKSPRIHIST